MMNYLTMEQSVSDSRYQRALTIPMGLELRPPTFTMVRNIWRQPTALPDNIIKQNKQYKNHKNTKTLENINIYGDFSPQGNDKKYKKIFEETSEIELVKEVRKLLENNAKINPKFKISRSQARQKELKHLQQTSYYSAAKERTHFWKKKFDECVKHMPPDEFLRVDYEPQMMNFDVGLNPDSLASLEAIVTKFTSALSVDHQVKVDINPLSGLIQWIDGVLSDPLNFLFVWSAFASHVYYFRQWGTAIILIGLTIQGIRKSKDTLEYLKHFGFESVSALTTWISDKFAEEQLYLPNEPGDCMLDRFEDTYKPQGKFDGAIDPISDGLFTLLFMKVFHTSYKSRNFSALARDLGSFDRSQKGVGDFVSWFMQRSQKFLNWMGDVLQKEVPEFISLADSDILDFSKEVAGVVNDFDDGVNVNFDFFVRVNQIKKRGEHLLANSLPSARDRRNALRMVLNKIQPLLDKCKANNVVHNGPRRTPLGILIGGAPGVGKSYSSIPLLHELIARVIDDNSLESFQKNPNDYILNRIWENEFWDADHGQFCIVYDDFGQSPNNVITKQNEYMEVIRGGNCLGYPLTMAALTDKGSTNYQHQLIFATTNITGFQNCMGVTKPEAVTRRFKESYWLAPRKEYCLVQDVSIMDRRLDISKCKGVFDEDVHEFFPYDFLRAKFKENCEGLTYRQLMDKIVFDFQENTKSEDRALANMHNAIAKGMQYRMQPQGIYSESKSFFHGMMNNVLLARSITQATFECQMDNSQVVPLPVSMLNTKDEALIKLCSSEIGSTDISDVEVLAINRELLANAISKVHHLNITVSRKIALTFTPDRDMTSWITLHCYDIPEVVSQYIRKDSSTFSSIMGGIRRASSNSVGFVREHPFLTKLIGAVAVLAPVVFIVVKCLSKVYPQAHSRHDWIKQRAPIAARQQYQHVRFIKQSRFDPQFNDIPAISQGLSQFAHKVFKKNTYLFALNHDRDACGSVTFIKDNVAVIPFHFIDKMLEMSSNGFYNDSEDPAASVELRKPNSTIKYCFKPQDLTIAAVTQSDTTLEDIAFVRFKNLHAHCDLTEYFIDIDHPLFNYNFNIMLNVVKETGPLQMISKGSFGHVSYGDYSVDCCIEYRLRTGVGDCGSVCYGHNPKTSKPVILGIHVAGSASGHGVSYFLSNLQVTKALAELDSDIVVPEIDEDEISMEPQMYVCHKLPENDLPEKPCANKVAMEEVQAPRSVTKTNIIPSAIYGEWGPAKTRPARLRNFTRDGKLVRPIQKAFKDYGGGFPAYNSVLMDNVTDEYIHHLHANADANQPWSPRLLSFEEAVEGVPGIEFCEGIPRATSPGYPLCMYTEGPGKTDFFGKDGPYDFDTPACKKLKLQVLAIIAKAKIGQRDKHAFMTFLKDERRKLSKYEDGETRMISGTDLAFLIACRMYFGDFIRWMMSNRIKNGSAVGVNPYGEEWAMLYRHVLNGDAGCIDGDHKQYDKNILENLHSMSFKVAESYYKGCPEEDTWVRRVFSQELLNPQYLCDGVIWSAAGSMPSGSFFTTMFNTIANNILLRYAIVSAACGKDHRIATEVDYVHVISLLSKEARFIALGDDNIWSVRATLKELVTPSKVAQVLLDLGYSYTAADKTPLGTQFRDLKFCTFLKRGFYVADKTVLAPLDIDTIKEMPYWTKRNAPPDNEYEVLTQALYELSLHSPQYFDKYAPKFIDASVKYYGKPPPFVSHRSCRAKIRTTPAMY